MNLQELITRAYQEDIPSIDITTAALDTKEQFGIAHLIAKQDLILSGTNIFSECLKHIDSSFEIHWNFEDGQNILNQQRICQIDGNLIELLKAERVALNFIGYLSGIATKTSHFVKACGENKTRILDTRKTLPLYRELSKKAVQDGGGTNHRMNLSDGILIKENHLHIGGGIKNTLLKTKEKTQLPTEIEVKNLEEVKLAVECGVHRIMLDNMSNADTKKALEIIPKNVETEASGNMTLERIPTVAALGVDFISVGALTHSAPCADISLLFDWE